MATEVPAPLQWLFTIVVDQSWPEGDEDQLRINRDAWHAASKELLAGIADKGNNATQVTLAAPGAGDPWSGDGAEAFRALTQKFLSGDQSPVKLLSGAAKALGDSSNETALEIEYTKGCIVIALATLAAQIAWMIATALPTFGASTAGIP